MVMYITLWGFGRFLKFSIGFEQVFPRKTQTFLFALCVFHHTFYNHNSATLPTGTTKTMENIPNSRPSVSSEVLEDIRQILDSGWLAEGKYAQQFEKEFAHHCGSKHAVVVSNGTTALFLALKALDIKPGDEVILPSLTFAACSNVIVQTGATPIFAEVEDKTFGITAKSIMGKITPRTKAIMPVNLYGQSCNMSEIMKIAKDHNLKVIEDSSQTIGALHRGKKSGSRGDIGSFSFHPSKNMTTGEGGMLVTNDDSLRDSIRLLKSQGMVKPAIKKHPSHERDFLVFGYNFRFPEISSAIGISQLKALDVNNHKRQTLAKIYDEALNSVSAIRTPHIAPHNTHVYSLYTIKCQNRDGLMQYLEQHGISCLIRHPPVHLEYIYKKTFGFEEGYLPQTEAIAKEILSLPMFPALTEEKVRYICSKIKEFYQAN
jgi:perosamine synthetase